MYKECAYSVCYFYDRKFFYSKYVYFPKYETEYIIYLLCGLLNNSNNKNNNQVIYDLCAGTGILGITAKILYYKYLVYCVDINKYAHQCVATNANLHRVSIINVLTDIFNTRMVFTDIVLCNPPYIESSKIGNVHNLIYKSLDGGNLGIEFTVNLLQKVCNKVKYMILELGSYEQYLILLNKVKNSFKSIAYIKPYNNAKVCFCVLENTCI